MTRRRIASCAAERSFLAELGGGCSVPVSAYAEWTAGRLVLRGRVSSPDGLNHIDVSGACTANDVNDSRALGLAVAEKALSLGADELLKAKP